MLKWFILFLVCLFIFAYPTQFAEVVTWAAMQIDQLVLSVRELLNIPVTPLNAPC